MAYYYQQNNGGFLGNLPVVTKNILIINVLAFLFTIARGNFMYSTFALYYPGSEFFHWWQPLTHMFMHGGWAHLFFNMFTFLMFGSTLERQWGPRKYLVFYLATGLGAAALHMGVMWLEMQHYVGMLADGNSAALQHIYALKHTPMVGASGAIYGTLMGYAMLFPDSRITMIFPPVSMSAKWWIIVMIVIELFTGVSYAGSGIAHFAHLGGMLFGWLIIRFWKKQGKMYEYEGEY